jgi:ATP-dependent Lhr-like helicase
LARRRSSEVQSSTPLKLDSQSGLELFLPVVAHWFRESLGTPTDAQTRGWNAIRAGNHSLIVAPTGSGKTLAAFLAGLDQLWRDPDRPKGVRILYISPLKALSQDIRLNLDKPLSGVSELARHRGIALPQLKVAVRTGDTPTAERQAQARKPPDVFITTPESLHLILGSAARAMLKPVRWVIVDELHSLAGQKRGTFLSVLLERLVEEIGSEPQRIGLTATVNPLESAACFLGGHSWVEPVSKGGKGHFTPRPVTIVRSVAPKSWDLLVKRAVVDSDRDAPRSIWPKLEKDLMTLVSEHRSTLVFANDRFSVERITARINALAAESSTSSENESDSDQPVEESHDKGHEAEASQEPKPESSEPDESEDFSNWVQAHHGSIALDRRRKIETDLKEGRLKGVICTASLEMGIDMGAVDLVCQIGSPGEVARGLQRVGRAGHGVGQVSKGRFFAKTTPDLLETAALVHAMSRGEVEPLAIPRNCLDILAQQVIACVAVRPWKPKELLRLFRRSESYQSLSDRAFESVLEMIAGRFRVEAVRDLKARIFWDRVRDELLPLPGTASLAMTGGGAITDTGQYPVKLGEDGPTLGSLDEEFVLERRNGESFRLGSSTWRIDRIDPDKVIVSPSTQGELAVMPFWRGETARRSETLGRSIGQLIRAIAEREDDDAAMRILTEDCRLDLDAAQDLRRMIDRQMRLAGAAPDDRTILVEAFRDPAGEVALAVMSPWGGRFHQALKLILQCRIEERIGIRPAAQHANDGLIMRLPRDLEDQPPLDVLQGLTFEEAERRLQFELADSALFGLRFRQNASRALLLPRPDPGKRTPLWLQRLRSKDLLGIVRQMPDFPIVVETCRECLSQDLDLDLLRTVLDGIASGDFRVVTHAGEAAGPFAADLMNRFERKYLYEWDDPHQNGSRTSLRSADRYQGPLLDELLEPSVVERLGRNLADSIHRPARSAEELAERLSRLGDLATNEVCDVNLGWLRELESRGICRYLPVRGEHGIWVPDEEFGTYAVAFPSLGFTGGKTARSGQADAARWQAIDTVLGRFVRSRALISLPDMTDRYPLESTLAAEWLGRLTDSGGFSRIHAPGQAESEMVWAETERLRTMIGQSLVHRRQEVRPIAPEAWSAWVVESAFATVAGQAESATPLRELESVLLPLQGWAATPKEWFEEILPVRCSGKAIGCMDDLLATGEWSWAPVPGEDRSESPRLVLFRRDLPPIVDRPNLEDEVPNENCQAILDSLARTGPATTSQLADRLGKPVAAVKQSLRAALLRGHVTNERLRFLDAFLTGDREKSGSAKSAHAAVRARSERRLDSFRNLLMQQGVGGGGASRGRAPFADSAAVEGRWRIVEAAAGSTEPISENSLAFAVAVLIRRYGLVCRETARFGIPGVPWPEMLKWLEAAEWRGDLRRGYFIEGLSGMQFTTEDVARDLALFAESAATANPENGKAYRWISAVDPANVFGASAPLDLPLIEGGRTRLPRIAGNSLVVADGAPVWIVQERGKRLTSLPHASETVLREALKHLVKIFTKTTSKWTVTTLDDAPAATTPYSELMIDQGFFRDGLSLTIYRGLI